MKWELARHLRPEKSKGPSQIPPRPMSEVSYAAPDDVDALVAFLGDVRDEIAGGEADFDLLSAVARELAHRVHGVALVVRGAQGIEASMGLRAERHLLSRSHYLHAVWNVVSPDARATGHAKSLLIEGRKFAESIGRPLLIEELTPDITNGKAKLIARHLNQTGAIFRFSPELAEAV